MADAVKGIRLQPTIEMYIGRTDFLMFWASASERSSADGSIEFWLSATGRLLMKPVMILEAPAGDKALTTAAGARICEFTCAADGLGLEVIGMGDCLCIGFGIDSVGCTGIDR